VQFSQARILIFAKAPIPGQVKTRLIPALGAAGAARLHRRLVWQQLERLAPAGIAPLQLWVTPDVSHAFIRALAGRFGLSLHSQSGIDLGERMHHAAGWAQRYSEAVVLVGTDCPALDAAYVVSALEALAVEDAVLGPAEDGGYALLGLRRAAPELFRDIPWGGERVAAITRARMRELGWRWRELPVLWDVDRPADLTRLSDFSA
jgi:rSAM/selenodomain-associated transferase 1